MLSDIVTFRETTEHHIQNSLPNTVPKGIIFTRIISNWNRLDKIIHGNWDSNRRISTEISYLLEDTKGKNQNSKQKQNLLLCPRKAVNLMLWYSALGRRIFWYIKHSSEYTELIFRVIQEGGSTFFPNFCINVPDCTMSCTEYGQTSLCHRDNL